MRAESRIQDKVFSSNEMKVNTIDQTVYQST